MRISSLKHLTRESQNKVTSRVRRFLKGNLFAFLLLSPALGYSLFMWNEANAELLETKAALRDAVYVSAMAGCPVFTAPGYILVTGGNVTEIKKNLAKVAGDIDRFNARIK